MKAKDFVLQHYPTAKAERHLSGRIKGFRKPYYLIRIAGDVNYLSEGTSESNAWVNAKKWIMGKDEN